MTVKNKIFLIIIFTSITNVQQNITIKSAVDNSRPTFANWTLSYLATFQTQKKFGIGNIDDRLENRNRT